MHCIAYNGGYKYQTKEEYSVTIDIRPDRDILTDYVSLGADGLLTIAKGYAWDGPSGPAIDTLTFMRGSLVHDALYQLMREGHLDRERFRTVADEILRRICVEDGMIKVRAWWVFNAVRLFANPASDPASKRPIIRAPKDCQAAPLSGPGVVRIDRGIKSTTGAGG